VEAKDFIKPPFASYDIVVYFGCGLFSLPLIFHYFIEPLGLRFPRFQFHIGIEFADVAVSTLSLLFTVYILGHMIAHIASHAIEKSVDLFFGKISTALIISDRTKKTNFAETVQGWIVKRFKEAFGKGHKISSALRTLFFFPVYPVSFFLIVFRQLEYFRSRVPPRVFAQVRRRSIQKGYGPVTLRTRWYKAIEHDVMNNNPIPVGRMYNYLVISGIFRSLTLIFLACAWCEVYFWMHRILHGHEIVKSLMSDTPLKFGHLTALLGFNVLFGFSLSAYLKFARRYVEEAVFAFALADRPSAVPSH
jgi:hypothetical protein